MGSVRDVYTARGGQRVVMGEILARGLNVAEPDADVGVDLVVIDDATGKTDAVQVKTATGRALKRGDGWVAQFRVPLWQLCGARKPELYYVFTVREGRWWEHLVMSRSELRREYEQHNVGCKVEEQLLLKLTFREGSVTGYGREWGKWRDGWGRYWGEGERGGKRGGKWEVGFRK